MVQTFPDGSPSWLGEVERLSPRPSEAPPDSSPRWWLINAAQAAFTCVWTGGLITAALVEQARTGDASTALRMARRLWGPGLLAGAGARLEVIGGDHVDWGKPHVFVMNHQSMIDIPAAFVALSTNLRFIAKETLSYVPFLGWYMRATGMIFVDRGNGARARRSLAEAGARIRAGASILAFAEGTRTVDGSIGALKKGAFVVAIEAGVPVVPVAIHGANRVLPRDGFRVRPGVIRVRIGAPIATEGVGYEARDQLVAATRRELIALHRSIGGPVSR